MLVERIMNKLKFLSIAQMLLPQHSLYRRRIPLFLSDIPVAVSNCRLYCHLLFALNPLSIHSLCFIKDLARPMSLYKPRRQEWLGRGTCLVNRKVAGDDDDHGDHDEKEFNLLQLTCRAEGISKLPQKGRVSIWKDG